MEAGEAHASYRWREEEGSKSWGGGGGRGRSRGEGRFIIVRRAKDLSTTICLASMSSTMRVLVIAMASRSHWAVPLWLRTDGGREGAAEGSGAAEES